MKMMVTRQEKSADLRSQGALDVAAAQIVPRCYRFRAVSLTLHP